MRRDLQFVLQVQELREVPCLSLRPITPPHFPVLLLVREKPWIIHIRGTRGVSGNWIKRVRCL